MDDIYRYIESRRQQFLAELFELIAQPSISTTGEGIAPCVELLHRLMEASGATVQIFDTDGPPMLFGEVRSPGAERTVLVYGHYDVQPPDPLDEWISPPFEPTVRNGKIYGRGSGDNKGQLFAQLKGVEAVLRSRGGVPANVKFLFEGGEEIGSPNISSFIGEHLDLLAADLVCCADNHHYYGERPEVVFGVRGLLYVEIRAYGPDRDRHSGNFGGLVDSPNERLARLIPHLKDEDNRVLIPGFYDDVLPPSELDLEALEELPVDETTLAQELGIDRIAGDPSIPFLQKRLLRPTLNVAGFGGGYTSAGMKTIIPHEAMMKIDMRLVDRQSPDGIYERLVAYLKELGYGDLKVRSHGRMLPWRTPLDHPAATPVIRAVTAGFGSPPYRVPSVGGSLPLAAFKQIPNAGIFLTPYGQHDENNHAPNECFAVENFFKGIRTMANLLVEMG